MDLSQRTAGSEGIADAFSGRKKLGSGGSPSSGAQAASSLALLLREDRALTEYQLHLSGKSEEPAFSYASALLENEETTHHEVTQRATDALAEVHRKLALVESLAERVSRTSPEAVAGPLLRLHGYSLDTPDNADGSNDRTSTGNATTLITVRERCERLKRQGEVLEGVARRVETSLQRGMMRMDTVTSRLSRVLSLSATLKMILRLKFEASKLHGYDLDDARDLTRAAASVAVVEDLLARPQLNDGSLIEAVGEIRPGIRKTAAAVRAAAAKLLEKHHATAGASTSSAVVQLGTTLQVYYHLGELPQATWKAVEHALASAEHASTEFFCPETISKITEHATTDAKRAGGKSDSTAQRILKKKLREFRAAAASKWGSEITEAALKVWNLHRVLCRKTDPVGRLVYVDVVAAGNIPQAYQSESSSEFSIFSLFWKRLCSSLAACLSRMLESENKKLADDAAALYPAVRSASLDLMGFLQDTMQAGVGSMALDDGTTSSAGGILGGSAALDDAFVGWSSTAVETSTTKASMLGVTSADTWTRNNSNGAPVASSENYTASATISLSAVFQSSEWQTLEGSASSRKGLYPLQRAFQKASMQRLCSPLQYMFPENVALDDSGLAASTLPMLPSKYDVQRMEEIIRQELSLADPREGGGDLSAVKMIAGSIREMVLTFLQQANNAVCSPPDDACLTPDGLSTNMMTHDIKVTKILVRAHSWLTVLDHTQLTLHFAIASHSSHTVHSDNILETDPRKNFHCSI